MKNLLIVLMVVWAISAIGIVVCVLLHSGKDAGLSDYFSNNVSTTVGTGIIEKNLDRLTVALSVTFALVLLGIMVVLPTL
ncbi:MAG: preprotein translocase subunit SecG [Coriobacteriia bacterium]|nr:preprotein translocase subunit SecG [Coriobacteriia bacterium]